MLAWAVQVDGNASMHLQFDERANWPQLKKPNTTGDNFDKFGKYLEARNSH